MKSNNRTRTASSSVRPSSAPPRKPKRWLLPALFVLGVALAWPAGVYLRDRFAVPPLPAPKLEGADPAIARAVQTALAAVRSAPRSGQAWGRLGMVLSMHDFGREAD